MTGAPKILLVGEDTKARGEIEEQVRVEFRHALIDGLASADGIDQLPGDEVFDLCIVSDPARATCMDVVERLRRHQAQCSILLVLQLEQEEFAAEASRQGISAYILRTPHYEPRLRAVVANMIHSREDRGQVSTSGRSSARQFHDVVENSAQGILIQVEGRLVYANAALAETLGYDNPEELLGLRAVTDFVDEWDFPRFQRISQRRREGKASATTYVFRARRKDGTLIWLENRVNRVSWNGHPALQCNMVDVSDRQRAVNALRLAAKVAGKAGDQESFDEAIRVALKWLARGMGWAVAESWIAGRDGEGLVAGPAWCGDWRRFRPLMKNLELHRFRPGEGLAGRVLASGLAEWMEDVSDASQRFRRSILANEVGLRSACAIPIIADGSTLAVLCFYTTELRARNPDLIAALTAGAASLGPVLLQIKTEQARRAGIARTETLVSRNADGILVVDQDDWILFANPAAERVFGRSAGELRAMQFGTPSTGSNVAEIEIRNSETGETRMNEMRVAEIEWDDRPARLVSLTDITERVEAQGALQRHREALQERVKELRCLYAVSNELSRTDIEWGDILKNMVGIVPGGWRYPEVTCVRLRVDDEEVMSDDFKETPWRLSSEIRVGNEVTGRLEVCYTEKKPEEDVGPFHREEQNLLSDLTRRIGQAISTRRYQRQLDESRRRFRDFAEAASDWLWEMDENLRFTYFSERIETVMGQPVNHWLGKSRAELSGEDTVNDPKWRRHMANLEAQRPFRDFRYQIQLPDGVVKHISISGMPVFDDKGVFRGFRGSGTDETQAVEARDQAEESERRLASVADRLPGVMFQRLRKSDGRVEYPYVSAGIDSILGHTPDEIQADPLLWMDMIHPEDRPRFDVAIADSSRTLEPMDIKFRMLSSSGDERWVWHRSRPRRIQDGDTLWDCIELDITEQKKAEARVQYLGYHDQLTGMPNRDLFVERVSQILPIASRNRETVAVAMLGLKRFKQVNEEFGMAGGDDVLRLAAERFKECLRPGDTVARLGGDRFLFLLPSVNQDLKTHKPFERLMESMDKPFTINQRQILVGFNMGIAVFPEDGDSAEELIQKADAAQSHYNRWGPGYGYTFYRDTMPASDTSRLALEKELNDAIESPDQLKAYFQPIYEAATGRLVAVETLARWMHPERGLIPPLEFIEMAEETGLINPLGLKILRQACVHAREWGASGAPEIIVTVNLSAKQIRNPMLASSIKEILRETGMPGKRLVLEVTESTLIADLDHATRFIEELVAEGIKFALDDFGVGYSSLSYLGRLPVDSLKIDRSFVRDLDEDGSRGEPTIRTIVALAHALNLTVVAEGVETVEQMEQVKRLGCDTLQGFLLGKPMPADDLGGLMARSGSLSVVGGSHHVLKSR